MLRMYGWLKCSGDRAEQCQ